MAARSIKPKASVPADEVEEVIVPDTSSAEVVESDEVIMADSVDETSEVSFEDKKQEFVEKNVRICPKQNHTCSIGGVRYYFEKGKCVNVPAEVKTILQKADLLMPL